MSSVKRDGLLQSAIQSATLAQSEATAKRAVIYLRVSSLRQASTDYDREGLSLPAQRSKLARVRRVRWGRT